MLPPIPRPEDYGVSAERGFLPSEIPLQCLPHQLYDRWERIMNNFQSLLLSKRLRTVIDKLPIIPAVHLESEAEWRRAYCILTFFTNGYIWGGDKPAEVSRYTRILPDQVLTKRRDCHPPSHILCCKYASTSNYPRFPHTRACVYGTSNLSFSPTPLSSTISLPYTPSLAR